MSSFPVLRTRLPVCFLSPFPDSLPQLFLRCLPCAFAFGLFPFLPLSFVCFRSGSGYLASVSSFPLSSRFCLTAASPVRPLRFHFFGFPRFFRPGFPCLLSRFFVLGFLFVSFHPSRFRSHSCSTGASLMLSPSGFSLPIRFLSSASLPVLTTQPLFLLFLFFPASPHSGFFQVLPLRLSASLLFHFRSVRLPLVPFRFKYLVLCNSFLRSLSRLTVATSVSWHSPFRFPAFSPWLSL